MSQVIGVLVALQSPVGVATDAAPADGDDGAGDDLGHAVPNGLAGRPVEGDELAQTTGADHRFGERMGEERLGLGGEEHAVCGGVVEERLDTHPVADHDQLAYAGIPDGEGVHAVEPGRHRLAPLQVGIEYDLGVAGGAEVVPASAQLLAQFDVVVHLTAVGQRDPAVWGAGLHRLDPAGQVDHGEPAVTEGGGPVDPPASGVGPPPGQRPDHAVQGGGLLGEVPVVGDPAGDAAHSMLLLLARFLGA
ncbi:hypothetical protein GCM10020254_79980 [Streptomyces goshikiensis]